MTEVVSPPTLKMFVAGVPRPQGSMRAFTVAGRVRLVHAKHDDLAVWRAAITEKASELWGDTPVLDEPVGVIMEFWLPRPPSIPKKRRHPDRLPDLDKLVRAVLDSLTGLVLKDDARVVHIAADKFYAVEHQPGADIFVGAIEQ